MKIVPTISSATAGPLGVTHLPRFWQKVLLSEKGLLPANYDSCGQGYDQMVLDGLGLDRTETLAFLKTVPTYFAFEKWILGKKGGKLDAQAVELLAKDLRKEVDKLAPFLLQVGCQVKGAGANKVWSLHVPLEFPEVKPTKRARRR